mmetsp:Transcript_34326/g.80222  ORF Transcript_34326/g.80222 Transcript_34326/m.80222 type:complete len:124 (+) Transcript_34326:379-750(+)
MNNAVHVPASYACMHTGVVGHAGGEHVKLPECDGLGQRHDWEHRYEPNEEDSKAHQAEHEAQDMKAQQAEPTSAHPRDTEFERVCEFCVRPGDYDGYSEPGEEHDDNNEQRVQPRVDEAESVS